MNRIEITTWEDWLTVSAFIAMHGLEIWNYELCTGGMKRIGDDGHRGRPYLVICEPSANKAGVFYPDQQMLKACAEIAQSQSDYESANQYLSILHGGFEDDSQAQGPSALGRSTE